MNNKVFFILSLMCCALIAQAQNVPQDNPPPDTTWESDPLDVLESKNKPEVQEPTVPEFTEIPGDGNEKEPAFSKEEVKKPQEAPPAVATLPAKPVVGEEPDYSKEAEFHRIYKTYNEQPTSEEAWGRIFGERKAQSYKVQKKDTLFDISKTFFGDPFYWPKVWSLNAGHILNPHEIVPGLNVQFFPGSMDEAPALELGKDEKKGEAVVDAEGKGERQKIAKQTRVQIPQPKKKRAPLLKNIPGSLPLYRMGVDQKSVVEFQVGLPKAQFSAPLEYLSYYINDEPVQGGSVVTATEMNMKTAGDYQYIYVRLDSGNAGKEYIAQKNAGPVEDTNRNGRRGYMIEIEGEVEILDCVNEQKSIYRAIVKKVIQPIEVGAILAPGKMSMFNPTAGEITAGVGAKIMGGQFDRRRMIFGSESLVFLDGGSSQGLREGQVLPVYADERVRNKKTDAITNDRKIGIVKVVRVSKNFATAYVAKADDDILLGDYVGKFQMQAFSQEDVQPQEKEKNSPTKEDAPSPGTDDSDLEI